MPVCAFYCCDEHLDLNGVGRIGFGLTFAASSSSLSAGAQGWNLEVGFEAEATAFWSGPCGLFSDLSYTTQDPLPAVTPPTVGWAPHTNH